MGAQVQAKAYFPGSMTDLNNGFHNGVWDLYHDDKIHKISGPGNSQNYDYFLMTQTMDGYTGYAKEQIRQTILKHESIFRHQLQELHRLYKRQRDLMNPVSSKLGHFLSQVSSDVSKEAHIFPSSFPLVNSTFNPMEGKSTLKDIGPLGVSERRIIDLELPANVYESNEWKQKVGNFQNLRKEKGFNLADLNEPAQVEEPVSSAFVSNNNNITRDSNSSMKRTLFGVEICEGSHTPTFQFGQNPASLHHNRWLGSFDSRMQNPGFFAGNSRSMTNSTSAVIGVLNDNNLKDSVSNSLEQMEKHTFLDMWKNHETTERPLPPWLTAKPCFSKEAAVHHINLDSLQNHSQQFFKKADMAEGNDTQTIPKILGVPIIDKKVENREMEDLIEENCERHQIDLNLSLEEDDASPVPPSFPESIVKIATMEIDLEAPAALESNNSPEDDNDIVKAAAEAIISISSSKLLKAQEPPVDALLWFADVITSKDFKKSEINVETNSVPEGMDYFEYMTLKLEDSKENYDIYKPKILENEEKEDDAATPSKRTPRKGQGRRKKDFQKDVLPSIVSLSRREVTEDLQIFEDALSATGVSWQSSLTKRKAAARNSRGRRRSVVAEAASGSPPPSEVEQTICREIIGGWGRRTRRLPRQRCQNGGNHHQSLALKC